MADRKFTVLIVEDHEDTAAVCCRLLRHYGHTASSVFSVDELVVKAKTETFDILVCDIGLAGTTGFVIPKLFPSVPAVAVTGYGTDIDVRACLDAGFCEHILKPFPIHTLLAAIERCGANCPLADASPWAITSQKSLACAVRLPYCMIMQNRKAELAELRRDFCEWHKAMADSLPNEMPAMLARMRLLSGRVAVLMADRHRDLPSKWT